VHLPSASPRKYLAFVVVDIILRIHDARAFSRLTLASSGFRVQHARNQAI
jgi:hypothetical protein